MTPIEIILKISNTQGTKAKEAILEEHKDNKDLQSLLYLAYSPFFSFGFTNLKVKEACNTNCQEKITEFIQLAQFLNENDINSAEVARTKLFLSTLREDVQRVYCGILNKNLSIGIAEKSINKVISNLIPTFECMLAQPADGFTFPSLVQEKLDGVRCIIIKRDGQVTAYTRKGNKIPLKKLADILKQFPNDNIVFDGELILAGELRKDTSGKINSLLKSGFNESIDDKLEYHLFDAMTLEEWTSKKSLLPAFDRAYEAASTVDILGYPFQSPKTILAENEESIAYFYNEIRKVGGEGVIVKTNTPYEWKRSKNWVKLKAICSCTLQIVGFLEGTGKNDGKVGAVSCISADGLIKVDVNPKTDEIREYITINQQQLMYSKVEVLFNELIQSKDGSYSLFLPRMADNWLRPDKSHADTLDDIKNEVKSEASKV